MCDVFGPRIFSSYRYFLGLIHKFSGDYRYLFGHGCRKKPGAFVIGRIGQDGSNVFIKAHIEHLICFVQNTVLYFGEINHSTTKHILHSSRRSDQYLRPAFYIFCLVIYTGTPINGNDIDALDVLGVIF